MQRAAGSRQSRTPVVPPPSQGWGHGPGTLLSGLLSARGGCTLDHPCDHHSGTNAALSCVL